jgi:hypothetical protein
MRPEYIEVRNPNLDRLSLDHPDVTTTTHIEADFRVQIWRACPFAPDRKSVPGCLGVGCMAWVRTAPERGYCNLIHPRSADPEQAEFFSRIKQARK